MTKMDQFVAAMELAFALSRELDAEGISHIEWSITYTGTTAATQEIKNRIDKAMINVGGELKSGAA